MSTAGALFELAGAALSIWKSKEARKYLDEKIKLEKDFYEEYNKPIGKRSDAVLDNIDRELRILCSNLSSAIGASNTPTK